VREGLSVAIITYNEERCIRRCLESVAFADEIVVVDSFSTDATPDICRRFGARVIQREWPGHVAQKNYAKEQTRYRWVLSVDADEVVSDELRREIEELLCSGRLAGYAGFYVPRRLFYLGRWIRHGGWYPDYKVRLFDKEQAVWAGQDPHDSIVCRGRTGRLCGDILHYSFENLAGHVDTLQKFTTISAEQLAACGRRAGLAELILRPVGCFVKMYFLRLGFLDGIPGLILCGMSAWHVFVKYAKLWEAEGVEGSGNPQ